MLDLAAIVRRTKELWTIKNDDDKDKMADARNDIWELIEEVSALRMKVDVYTKHARMDARKRAARC